MVQTSGTIEQPLNIFDSASFETSNHKNLRNFQKQTLILQYGFLWPPNWPNLWNSCTAFKHFCLRIFWYPTLYDQRYFQEQPQIFLKGLWWPPNGPNLWNSWTAFKHFCLRILWYPTLFDQRYFQKRPQIFLKSLCSKCSKPPIFLYSI